MRVAPAAGPGVLTSRRRLPPAAACARAAALGLAACLAACRPAADRPAPAVEWQLTPAPPVVGPARLAVTLRDQAGRPASGATVRVEAHMTHPGMSPVLSEAVERGGGRYEAALDFTMAGHWVVLLKGRLADGAALDHRIDLGQVGASP